MRRPPLISFLTFNRLGNTAISLPSLLRTYEDFELYIIDNGSQDDTWQFINDTKDPRIKHIKRFDVNVGGAHGLNYALSHRKEDQDWINYEYDFRIHDKYFVTHFREYYEAYPEFGAFSAIYYPEQVALVDSLIEKHPERLLVRNDLKVYLDTVMGFCTFIPYETMNLIGYYDESTCALDVELNQRINQCLNQKTGYAMGIHCSQAYAGGYCCTCIAFHEPCDGGDKCLKLYNRIITKVFQDHRKDIGPILTKRLSGELPVKCNSIYSGLPMSDEERAASMKTIELFEKYSKEYLDTVIL